MFFCRVKYHLSTKLIGFFIIILVFQLKDSKKAILVFIPTDDFLAGFSQLESSFRTLHYTYLT